MRLLHTSDWHLGHSLHNHDRTREHTAFLAWLTDQIDEHAVDAVLIAGDIFDTANPSAAAQTQWYRFLANTRARFADLDIVVIGGNHDSAARLDAPQPVLDAMNITLVGGARRHGLPVDAADMVVPLHGPDGAACAWVAAVPYLRVPDLPRVDIADGADPVIEGVRAAYAAVLEHAESLREPGQALIAMGHCYMSGTELSENSERRILIGNQHALPADIFPESVAYAALGHLHKPQRVLGERVRYCGSPIPLSLSERTYKHQVLLVDLDGDALSAVTSLPIPRTVDMVRIPTTGAASLKSVLDGIGGLDPADDDDREAWPFLEVHVHLPRPEPSLRRQIERALEDRRARVVRIVSSYAGSGDALGDATPATSLGDLTPVDVFTLAWARKYDDDPPDDVLARFAELQEQAEVAS